MIIFLEVSFKVKRYLGCQNFGQFTCAKEMCRGRGFTVLWGKWGPLAAPLFVHVIFASVSLMGARAMGFSERRG